MSTNRLVFACIAVLLLIAGCGGGGGGSNIPVTPDPDNPSVNRAPVITSLSPQGSSADPIRIQTDRTQQMVVAATDPDGDKLTYTWSVDNGRLAGTDVDYEFTAPSAVCNAIVTVVVNDGHNHTASAKCYFTVYKQNTPEPPNPNENDPPVITSVTADPSAVDVNGTSTVTAVATDPDGDDLTYTWVATGGSVQSQNGNSAVWKAPEAAGSCTMTVFVSDGVNPAVSKAAAISVAGKIEPPVTNGLTAKYIQNNHVDAHPDLSKGQVVLTRTDPNINFDWGRKAPDPGLITLPDTGNGHDFGVIWSGYIKCETAGAYAFRARYDDGFRLRIADDSNKLKTIIDGWNTGPALVMEGKIDLAGSKWYKIEVSYFEDEDRSYVQLYWMPPGATTWTIVPTNALRTAE
ncbi:MAG: PA14 domain-containing protein [Armatimonadota bacterium]